MSLQKRAKCKGLRCDSPWKRQLISHCNRDKIICGLSTNPMKGNHLHEAQANRETTDQTLEPIHRLTYDREPEIQSLIASRQSIIN